MWRRRAANGIVSFTLAVLALALASCSSPTQNDGVFVFGRGIAEEEREPIQQGVDAMVQWLEAEGGVRLRRFKVEVHDDVGLLVTRYDYYNPNLEALSQAQWFISGGAIAVGDVVYIYVGDEWRDYSNWQKASVAAHEVFHVAQYGFAWDDYFIREMQALDFPPDWLVEGTADYAAARALDAADIYPFEQALEDAQRYSAAYRDSLVSLSIVEGTRARGDAAPYAVGFLAVHELVERSGMVALFDFWDFLAERPGWAATFTEVFGEEPPAFARRFDSDRIAALPAISGGISGQVTRSNGEPIAGASVAACEIQADTCVSTFTDFNGAFNLALEPGEYALVYRVASRGGIEVGMIAQWDSPVTVEDDVVDGLVGVAQQDF